jgi:HPt (histidine-containing phosphotransfer) domain-containing protein
MSDVGGEACKAIDKSVLASLRELQEDGEPDIVAEVGDLFIKYSPEKISAIEQSVENGDAKGLQMAAHSLKSSSAYVGALRLSTLSKELEMMGRSQALQEARVKADLLKSEYQRVLTALEAEIRSGKRT